MVRNVKGFTFVELMISMIILSIVLTIVTGTMVYISKRNSAIDENSHGYQIAKEKLIELQGGGETVSSFGSDEPERNGINYKRSWKIVTDTLPYPVTVTVIWTTDGLTDSVVVVGYVNSGVCEEVTGNSPPGGVKTFNAEGTEITDAVPIIPIAKNGDVFVCSLYAYDKDTGRGDIVSLGFHPDGTDNDNFYINDKDHLYSKAGTQDPGDYSIKLVATDCANLETTKDIRVTITEDVNLVVEDNNASITENSANDTYVATMSASPGADSWQITSGDPKSIFKIDASGVVSVNAMEKLDFEDTTITNPMEISIKATYGGKEGVGKLYLTIKDTNEAPYDITMDTDTIVIPISSGVSVIELTGHDQDAGDDPKTLSFTKVYSPYDFGLVDTDDTDFILHYNGIAFKSSSTGDVNNLSHGDSFKVQMSVNDDEGETFQKELTIFISTGSVTDGCTCSSGCDAITTVTGNTTIKTIGCYFHQGDFAPFSDIAMGWSEVKINGQEVFYYTTSEQLPEMIDGGYYIEFVSKSDPTHGYFTVPASM